MPQESLEAYVGQLLSKYQYPDRAKKDVCSALQNYRNLFAKLESFVFNDGTRRELVCLDGTIPVRYKRNVYNIPICIWLLDTHPYTSPMCYVKPTADMQIKASRHVDNSGRIYLPYLHDWNPTSSDLLGVIQVMIIVFGEVPPVYSKPKVQDPTYGNTPYPPQSTGFMPMPQVCGGSSVYPPYPPTSGSGPYPPATTYSPFPGFSSASNYPYYSTPGYPPTSGAYTASPTPGYPPQNPPTTSTVPQTAAVNNMGTISEEHIRASLLSAVEDKLKKRFREVLAQSQAEVDVLKKTQDDLNKGKVKLQQITAKLQNEQMELEKNIHILREKNDEMKTLLTKMENQEEVVIDDAVITTAPIYKQLLNAFAEENATQDAIYYLGEALRKDIIDLDVFLKHIRQLSRKQFMLRALMQKCRQKAGLSY